MITMAEKEKTTKSTSKQIELPKTKLFGKWENEAEFTDPGLKKYISIKPIVIPKSYGVASKQRFHKSKMHIVERLALHMLVPGHTGKHHKLSSGMLGGACDTILYSIEQSLQIIEEKTKTNPIQVVVKAIENGAAIEEITSYQLGSITARDAVISSPQRRVDKTLRNIAQGVYKASFRKKKKIRDALADELIAAYKGDSASFAIKEKERVEREAVGAR